jgi:hypothetical protein
VLGAAPQVARVVLERYVAATPVTEAPTGSSPAATASGRTAFA